MIKWDKSGLKHINESMREALELTAYEIQDEVREEMIVPRDTGNLQNEGFFVDTRQSTTGIVKLIFNTPYARRLYFHPEYHFSKEQNPKARGMWMEPWVSGVYKDHAAKIFSKICKRFI